MSGPPDDATPVHTATAVTLDSGQRAAISFQPEQSGSRFRVPVVAIDRSPSSTYEVLADGVTVYDESPVPPTDTNNLSRTFWPGLSFGTELKIIVRNADTVSHSYAAQVSGWEVEN